MTKTLKHILAALLTVLIVTNTHDLAAQASKPVTVLVSLTPPYSPFLNEYASASTNRLQVTLIVNDSRMQNYPVKLQMFIERAGSGVVMRSSEYTGTPTILLNGGTTEILSGASLTQYFQVQNNVFTGFDQAQYLQTGRIPDGQYRIGFRVVDARRSEVVLSNLVFSQPGWFLLNDPPQLNMPRNKNTERVNDPQNIKLEWFPRHLGSMNAAFTTIYHVELFALRVPGMDPNQIATSLPPDYTVTTNLNRYTLLQANYMLEPGIEYAWRIKAMAGDGFTLFQNNGYSEVYSFVYGSMCPVPENVDAYATGTEKAKISWDTDPVHSSYDIRFRLQDDDEGTWHSRESFTGDVEIAHVLSPGTSYEYQLKAKCTNTWSEYSPLKTFTTSEYIPPANFECGKKTEKEEITNFTPKISLKPGDIIYNGEFPVKLIEIDGGSGTFSGKGCMRVPMLANVQINMQFTNIKVNELNQVYAGEMISVYNPDSPFFIEDLSDYWGEGDQIGNVITGQDSAAITLAYTVNGAPEIIVTTNGNTVIITGGGGSTTVDVDDAASGTTIVDDQGNLFAVDVDDNGNTTITQIGTSGGNTSSSDYNNTAGEYNQLDSSLTVTFANNGRWAFDERNPKYGGSLFDGEYEKTGDYYVPWKFIPIGKSDKIKAGLTAGTIDDPTKLKFLTPTGTEFFAEYNNGWYEIEVTGAKERDGIELYAIYQPNDSTKIPAGKLKIASYPRLSMKVKLIPMGNFRIDGIVSEDLLNKIYAPYYIDWKIGIEKEFTDTTWDTDGDGLQATGSEFYSMFTAEMRALNATYEEERGLDEESLYLFIFPDGDTGQNNLLGDMPLKSRFGYIFNAKTESTDKITRTVAHELGHGAFQLKHTFSEKYNIKVATQNLMDYNGGIELVKYQWDVVHDPQNKLFNWAQDEEEGQAWDDIDPLLEHILSKAQELHISTDGEIRAIVHCAECSENSGLIEITSIYKEFGSVKGLVIKMKNKNCFTIFYDGTNLEVTKDASETPVQSQYDIVIVDNSLTVNYANNFCLNCNDYLDNLGTLLGCPDANVSEKYINKLYQQVETCINAEDVDDHFSGSISTFTSSNGASITEFENSLQTQLDNETFNDIKFAVNIFSSTGEKKTLYTKEISSEDQADLTLNYYIDYDKSEVKVSVKAKDNYLQGYESKVSGRASAKGYNDVDVSGLRQQVLDDIHTSIEYSTIRAEKEKTKSEEKAKECLRFWQVAQKNVKSVWDEGTMHKGTWHSNDPQSLYDKFPGYSHFGPVVTGACDEVIDKVAGIPLMIKTGYEIMSDDQKLEALVQTFTTKEGLTSLWEGLKAEFTDFASDGQRQTYTVSQVTTMIGFAVITGGGNTAVKGAKKGVDVLGEFASLANKFDGCPKLAKYFDDIKKLSKNLEADFKKLKELTDVIEPFKLEKALSYLGKSEIDEIITKLHKLRGLDGIDKIVADLGHEGYTKFLGSRFVLDYTSKLDDALISAKKVAFEVKEVISIDGKDVDRFYDVVVDGARYEMKAWSKWHTWSDDVIRKQFVRDLANPDLSKVDELNWVFKKTDGITDIDVLRKNVISALEKNSSSLKTAFEANRSHFRKMFGDDIKTVDDIIDVIDDPDTFKLIFEIY